MSLKNIWRLRFFINRYSPSDKKKRYMNNKLDELEEQIEKMKCCSNCKYNINIIEINKKNVDRCEKCLGTNRIHWELVE